MTTNPPSPPSSSKDNKDEKIDQQQQSDEKKDGTKSSLVETLFDKLTRQLESRYHLSTDDQKQKDHSGEEVGSGRRLEDITATSRVTSEAEEVMLASDYEDSPALTDEMVFYRQYGLQVASQISNFVKGSKTYLFHKDFTF